MPRRRKSTTADPAERPPQPKSERLEQPEEPVILPDVLDASREALAERLSMMTTAELPDPKLPTFAEKLASSRRGRPSGPRRREPGVPAATFASEAVRITLQDRVWQVEARRDLTGTEKDRLAASGFQAVDDDERVWNAAQAELIRRGTDINVVAFELSGKAARAR